MKDVDSIKMLTSERGRAVVLFLTVALSGISFSSFLWVGQAYASPSYIGAVVTFAALLFVFGQLATWGQAQLLQARLARVRRSDRRLSCLVSGLICVVFFSALNSALLLILNEIVFNLEFEFPLIFLILLSNSSGKLFQINSATHGYFAPLALANVARATGFLFGCCALVFFNFEVPILWLFLSAELCQVMAYYGTVDKNAASAFWRRSTSRRRRVLYGAVLSARRGLISLPVGLNSELFNRADVITLAAIAEPRLVAGYGLVQNAHEAALVGLNALKLVYLRRIAQLGSAIPVSGAALIDAIWRSWRLVIIAAVAIGIGLFWWLAWFSGASMGLTLAISLAVTIIGFPLFFHWLLAETILVSAGKANEVIKNQSAAILLKFVVCVYAFNTLGIIGMSVGVGLTSMAYALLCRRSLLTAKSGKVG